MVVDQQLFKQELETELHGILQFWMRHAVDDRYGGFCGKIDNDNTCHYETRKGAVLHTRILWAFSTAFINTKDPAHIQMADRAYQYILDHFIDHKYGGIYWSVDHNGANPDTRKQVFALAFAIYGFSEYFRATQWQPALELAVHLYELIQRYSFDTKEGGYLEAFTADWQPIDDLRLSDKDANEKKTMNTHLHVLEAYTSLYGIWPDAAPEKSIALLINDFHHHIIDIPKGHLHLFFDEHWRVRSNIISYGHDIEAGWLLTEAAYAIANEELIQQTQNQALLLANAVIPALDIDGGLWYEQEIKEKHWWPQAEAMVGFFNAWQISGQEKYLRHAYDSWSFIKKYLLDHANGEWFWGIDAQHRVMPNQVKAGFWKCPYHNSRACLEIIKRIDMQDEQ